ncbi:MAG: hypothetical protein O7C59_11970 [Rickettsia endosymbiont of Ixodes persulcatus]|nr:hypothetical protein [Rickettsia endosymbiont of Ixodes persulcatus]
MKIENLRAKLKSHENFGIEFNFSFFFLTFLYHINHFLLLFFRTSKKYFGIAIRSTAVLLITPTLWDGSLAWCGNKKKKNPLQNINFLTKNSQHFFL